MAVEPVGDGRFATEARLPRRFLFPGDVARATVCATPVAVMNDGLSLDNNLLMTSLALTTLAEPLLVPTPPIPSRESASITRFAFIWALSETDRFVKSGLLMLPFVLLSMFSWFSTSHQQRWLEEHFAWVPRLPDSLSLPLGFYVPLWLVLMLRSLMLLSVPTKPVFKSILGWTAGSVVLIYLYNLTGQVHLSEDNWEAPVGGLMGALFLKFLIALHWARRDSQYEVSSREEG